MQLSVYWGFSCSTLYWFYRKRGVFQVEEGRFNGENGSNTSDKADNEDKLN